MYLITSKKLKKFKLFNKTHKIWLLSQTPYYLQIQKRVIVSQVKHHLQSSVSIAAPKSLAELKHRLDAIKGVSLEDICRQLDIAMPENSTRGKGFTGQVIEYVLGADAKTLPLPDFRDFALELKTLPVDANLKPLESTFLCHANLNPVTHIPFEKSALYKKTRCMLFVFILSPDDKELGHRRILGYYFFMPDKDELETIKADYDELMDMVCQGRAHEINARIGTIVQMRPKAASGRELTQIVDRFGQIAYTRPRGFYMRRSFTQAMCIKLQGNLKPLC